MVIMYDYIYNLNEGKVEFAEKEKFENANSIDEAFKNSIDGLKQLGYQEVKFDNLKMFIKYNKESVSTRTLTVVIFEELKTETDVLDETLDDLYDEIEDDLDEMIDDEFIGVWNSLFK